MNTKMRELMVEQVKSGNIKMELDGTLYKKNVLAEDGSGYEKYDLSKPLRVRSKEGDVFYTKQDILDYIGNPNIPAVIPEKFKQRPVLESEATATPEIKQLAPMMDLRKVVQNAKDNPEPVSATLPITAEGIDLLLKKKYKKITPEILEEVKALLKEEKSLYFICDKTRFSIGALNPHFKKLRISNPELFTHIKTKK